MEDFWVALAGPLTHIPMAAVWFALFCIMASPASFSFKYYFSELGTLKGWFAVLFQQAVVLNLIIFAFNLFIPAYPLDGGRCFAAMLVLGGVPVPKAAIITAVTAELIAGCMIAFGVYQVFFSETGMGGIMFILIGVFILYLSHSLYRMARAGRVYEHPLFAKDCYRHANSEQAHTGDGGIGGPTTTTNAGTIPSTTVPDNTSNTEMGTLSWEAHGAAPPNEPGSSAQQQDQDDLNVAGRLRLGMERMFRKDESKTSSTPDLTV